MLKFDFSHRHVLITGGAQGIGLETARQFLVAGAKVTIWDFSDSALAEARATFSEYGEKVCMVRVDISKADACAKAASAVSQLDVLVNNAGITRDKSVRNMTLEQFDSVIQTNLQGTFYVTKSLLEHFNDSHKNRRVINIASVVALYGNFGQANYVAAKAGVIGLTKTLARELGPKGFTVNSIAPGFIATAMVEAMPREAVEKMQNKVPVGRLGRPEDIANGILYLSSDAASYINGTVLSIDGGLVC